MIQEKKMNFSRLTKILNTTLSQRIDRGPYQMGTGGQDVGCEGHFVLFVCWFLARNPLWTYHFTEWSTFIEVLFLLEGIISRSRYGSLQKPVVKIYASAGCRPLALVACLFMPSTGCIRFSNALQFQHILPPLAPAPQWLVSSKWERCMFSHSYIWLNSRAVWQ